jgi:hypothetical protein
MANRTLELGSVYTVEHPTGKLMLGVPVKADCILPDFPEKRMYEMHLYTSKGYWGADYTLGAGCGFVKSLAPRCN